MVLDDGKTRHSLDDLALMRRLHSGGKLLNIELADFLVLGSECCWSARNQDSSNGFVISGAVCVASEA